MKNVLLISGLVLTTIFCQSSKQIKEPVIITKAEWGGKPPTGEKEPQTITHITIHHAGEIMAEDRDPKEAMRALQRFSIEDKNWIDIPYHYCIDLNGNIYEARPVEYAGDTNTEYDPIGHALIEVMGNYEVQKIKPAQIDAIVVLSAWLAQKYDVPVSNIATHKDYSSQTVCPGKDLYKYFQDSTIVKRVDKMLRNTSN